MSLRQENEEMTAAMSIFIEIHTGTLASLTKFAHKCFKAFVGVRARISVMYKALVFHVSRKIFIFI